MEQRGTLIIFTLLCVLLVCTLNTVKASQDTDGGTLTETTTLPDGVVETRYANGTVKHEFYVTSQIPINIGLSTTTTTTTTTTVAPPTWIDTPDNEPINWNLVFTCVSSAGAILVMLSKAYPKPKPVARPMPKIGRRTHG